MLALRLADMVEGEGERSGVFSTSRRDGDRASREDQNSRGEALAWVGEVFSVKGEASRESIGFWQARCQWKESPSGQHAHTGKALTLVAWL